MENGGATAMSDVQKHLAGRARSGSASSGHKRTLSGTLMSKLSFLRMSQAPDGEASLSPNRHHHRSDDVREDGDSINNTPTATASDNTSISNSEGPRASAGNAMATAIQQRKMRRRRGSLRKTALLGTRLELKEKRSNNATTARSEGSYGDHHHHHHNQHGFDQDTSGFSREIVPADDEPTPRPTNKNTKPTPSYWPRSLMMRGANLSSLTAAPHHQQQQQQQQQQNLQQPATRNSLISDTTDDEDDISISAFKNESPATKLRPASVSSSGSAMPPPIATPSSSTDSYFALRRQPAATAADSMALQIHRARSPLATHSTIEMANHVVVDSGEWDYSETEWWGWTILFVTWLVFVVGMGSSFGVWSWAWDVGETPYAPPELEDDPTLPIVGYYPALLVLTAVMAWVWVVVAWVGMKYFKHANISGDDG
ncbi:hypothetical protein PISL3812_00448 [Talaromyces islandicus]|uniref:Uncharacterized protein n=1 Tax=Talaromyces islandicus TaxID=28573 RepID=A0A0U1LL96_TALIS|nr:hypothetical protein PISL3812_00448 [Talaromyces islandicus]